MKLELFRQYFPNGTNGELFFNGKKVCDTIELPWKENHRKISCVPEGVYRVGKGSVKDLSGIWKLLMLKTETSSCFILPIMHLKN